MNTVMNTALNTLAPLDIALLCAAVAMLVAVAATVQLGLSRRRLNGRHTRDGPGADGRCRLRGNSGPTWTTAVTADTLAVFGIDRTGAPTMRRCLILANQTLSTDTLCRAVQERLATGPHD